jgi:hypothetical protein
MERRGSCWSRIADFCSFGHEPLNITREVNRSQMGIKRKTCDIRTWKKEKKIYFSTCPPPTLTHCPIALPVRRNPQHRSLLNVVSAISASPFQPFCYQWNVCHPVVNRFTRQTLPTVNRKHSFMNILSIEFFCPPKKKTLNRALFFGSIPLKHSRQFDYRNRPLNMCMRVCYLDRHEAGLCCYLVIHIENLLRLIRLFYFHLWHIYWLSVVKAVKVGLTVLLIWQVTWAGLIVTRHGRLSETETRFKRRNRSSVNERMRSVVTYGGMSVRIHGLVREEANKSEEKLYNERLQNLCSLRSRGMWNSWHCPTLVGTDNYSFCLQQHPETHIYSVVHEFFSVIYSGVFTPCKNCNVETCSRDYATVDEAVFSPCRAEPSCVE